MNVISGNRPPLQGLAGVVGRKPGALPRADTARTFGAGDPSVSSPNGASRASLGQRPVTNAPSPSPVLIRQGLSQPERLLKLNEIAITQMRTLLIDSATRKLRITAGDKPAAPDA